jgi:unsaturated rhamnogalacturonyl hydrolase
MQNSVLNHPANTATKPWSQRIAVSALNRYSITNGQWSYQEGLLFKGIWHLSLKTNDPRYWQKLAAYVDHYVTASGDIKTYSMEEYNIDLINPGKLLFPLYQATGNERYRKAIELLREQLCGQPRTEEGGFWHKKIYPYQMWLDGIYMGSVFFAEYAATFNEPADFDDVAFQVITIEKHTRDPITGLLYHAWDESRQQPWADPDTGCSPHFWSRAIGWYCMAIVDILDFLPGDHKDRYEVIAILERTLTAIARVQDKDTGLWWQVLDQGNRQGNYLEASGTSMFIYAIAKGVRKGYLNKNAFPIAEKGFEGLLDHLITVDDEGQVNLHGVCASAGLGGIPFRDGSYEYYINESIATNNLHGVGAFILAAHEIEQHTTAIGL